MGFLSIARIANPNFAVKPVLIWLRLDRGLCVTAWDASSFSSPRGDASWRRGTSLHTECLPFAARASSIAALDASERLARSGYSSQLCRLLRQARDVGDARRAAAAPPPPAAVAAPRSGAQPLARVSGALGRGLAPLRPRRDHEAVRGDLVGHGGVCLVKPDFRF